MSLLPGQQLHLRPQVALLEVVLLQKQALPVLLVLVQEEVREFHLVVDLVSLLVVVRELLLVVVRELPLVVAQVSPLAEALVPLLVVVPQLPLEEAQVFPLGEPPVVLPLALLRLVPPHLTEPGKLFD